MKTYQVERSEGPAGCEKTIWQQTCEAGSAAEAIRMSYKNTEEEEWPITVHHADLAFADHPEYHGDKAYQVCLIASELTYDD